MARRKKAQRALVIPDPTYKSRLVTLLINKVLQEGKKGLSQKNCLYFLNTDSIQN
jgi:ribosomal protein S7